MTVHAIPIETLRQVRKLNTQEARECGDRDVPLLDAWIVDLGDFVCHLANCHGHAAVISILAYGPATDVEDKAIGMTIKVSGEGGTGGPLPLLMNEEGAQHVIQALQQALETSASGVARDS